MLQVRECGRPCRAYAKVHLELEVMTLKTLILATRTGIFAIFVGSCITRIYLSTYGIYLSLDNYLRNAVPGQTSARAPAVQHVATCDRTLFLSF